MARTRRLTTSLATLVVLAGAGGLSWYGAGAAATFIEARATRDVTRALQDDGHDWAEVRADGLRVQLTGTAPSEVERFRALAQAGTVVDAARVLDQMSVASIEAMAAPEFKVELLRNETGLSMIGLVPAATDRDAVLRGLRPAGVPVTDLMESADHPAPEGWDDALRFALDAVRMAPRSKVSVAPGRVEVTALAQDREDQMRLEEALRRAAPPDLATRLEISAPRPVIAPFALRFVRDAGGARLETCAAADEAGRGAIAEAARAAGLTRAPDCVLGLGAPSPDWPQAAVAAIGAVGDLGQGRVVLSDADVALDVPADVTPERFAQVAGALEQALPQGYRLEARHDQPSPDPVPVEFLATLPPSGSLTMRGRIADAQMQQAVDSFARARFDVGQSGLLTDTSVPGGWTVRVIAGLEAMAALHAGQARVTPEMIELTGVSGDPQAGARAARMLSDRLGAGVPYRLAISYDRRLDEELGLPDGEACVARMNIIMSESEIGFEPNRSSIAGDPGPTLARFAQAMTDCTDFQIEAGGHTDSQGSEGFNAELSRSRAQAIVTAMADAGIPVSNMSVRGYGESRPVATNQTEEGREINRRIEFRLLSPHPIGTDHVTPAVVMAGVTGEGGDPAPAPDWLGPRLPPLQGPRLPATDPQMQGPLLPAARAASGMVPMTVGVAEQFQTLDAREESLRVPVQTADDDTPRPGARPAQVAERAGTQQQATEE